MRSVSNCRRGVSQALGDRGPKSLIRDERDRETKDLAAWCLRRSFSGSPSRAGFCRSVGLFFLVVCLVGCATVATPHLRWMMNERSPGRGIWMFAPAASCFFLSFFASSHPHRGRVKETSCVEGRHGDIATWRQVMRRRLGSLLTGQSPECWPAQREHERGPLEPRASSLEGARS
jgi:hypothetical protein